MPDQTAVRSLRERAVNESTLPVEELKPFFNHDRATVRHSAAEICRVVGSDDVDGVASLRPELVHLVETGPASARESALVALQTLASERPNALEADVDVFVNALQSDLPTARLLAAQVLSILAIKEPSILSSTLSRLLSVLVENDGNETVVDTATMEFDQQTGSIVRNQVRTEQMRQSVTREITANAVVEVARTRPATVATNVDAVVSLLDDDNDEVVAAAIDVLAALGQTDIHVEDEAVDALGTICHHGTTRQRARAIRALGFLEATSALDDIEEVATNATDGELRELASATVTWLQDDESSSFM